MLKKVLSRRPAYYIASAAFIVLGFVYFLASINQPYIGLDLIRVNGQWSVSSTDPYGEGYKSGINVGDLILKVNNHSPDEYNNVLKWSEVEGASTIEFQRKDQNKIDINDINIYKSSTLLTVLSECPMAFLGFIFWLLGFLTWFKRSFLVQARDLFWLNLFIGLAIVLASASSRDLLYARELEYIVLASIPMLLNDFISDFPKENENRVSRFEHILFAFMSIIITILTILQSISFIHNIYILRKLLLLIIIIGITIALLNLGHLIKLPKDIPEKNQAIIILLGMAIGFLPLVILTAIPVIFNSHPLMNAEVSSLFLSVIPVTWYYVIVNKYLPDSQWLLEVIVSFFVAVIIVNFFVLILLLVFKIVLTITLQIILISLSLTMFIMICFSIFRALISYQINKLSFFNVHETFKERILKLNERLSIINDEDKILNELVHNLSIEGAFFIIENSTVGYLKKAIGSFLEKPSHQVVMEEFFQADRKINLDVQILPDYFPAEIYIPFVIDDFLGGIFLGHRCSKIKFSRNELPLITLVSSQLAQRLLIIFVIREMSRELENLAQKSLESQKNKGFQGITTSLFKSIEKEKKIMAAEVHDGPLQLGLDLSRWLKYLTEECKINNDEKIIKAISHMLELVENLNFELRLICNNLRPPSLKDLGLISAVELLCEEIMIKESLVVSLETEGISREDRFKEEIELVVYRFLQEGLSNAVKHSGSKEVKVSIEMNESRIELRIKDLGKGFDTSKIGDWSLTSEHFGIIGMKERLESLGGNFQVISAISQGTTLIGTIPIV